MFEWSAYRDFRDRPADEIPGLLEQLRQEPTAELWHDLRRRLTIEGECHSPIGAAALTGLAAIAASADAENQHHALALAAAITTTLHVRDEDDEVFRTVADVFPALHRLAAARLADDPAHGFECCFRAALAFGGYVFWARIGLDYSDEHYVVDCPHCATRLAIVIGDYGRYCAVRDGWAGDIHRVPLTPADPDRLDGIAAWMHGAALACGRPAIATGLAHLFGTATCTSCGSTFNLAAWLEAQNTPHQPLPLLTTPPPVGGVQFRGKCWNLGEDSSTFPETA
ncbi:hypothetical protein [Catellatospora sp. TT07R-123]|uniref:hypothetical protein n=1 Tax=Catellatospora sp. TT07R-123 TaxID=2733863 RepID=UPI001BB38FEB|nr:hypothetical protein [Catellatospora sp. TT07R-123]